MMFIQTLLVDMKKYHLIFILFLLTGFISKSPNPYVPSDLKTSEIIIVKRKFSDWIKTIDVIPNGYDSYAQNGMYKRYESTILDIEELFKEKQVKYSIIELSENISFNSGDYKLDYKLNCSGGERTNDWWQCLGGFYFVDLKNGNEFTMMGPDTRAYKDIKKGIKNSK